MLKGIVENKRRRPESLPRPRSGGDAVGIGDHDRFSHESFRQLDRLIASRESISDNAFTVRHEHSRRRVLSTITTRENADFLSRIGQDLGDVSNERSLPGPAGRDVPDTDRSRSERVCFENTSIVESVSDVTDVLVEPAGYPEHIVNH